MPRSPDSEPLSWPMFVPPPVWFAAAFLAGWTADRRLRHVELLPAGGETFRRPLAIVIVVAALILVAGALLLFLRARATILPVGKTGRLVTDGVYRVTRNPMYVGLTLLYLALTLWLDTLWPLLFLPVALLVVGAIFIPYEERRMHRLFGAEYDAYRSRVRRWL